MRGAALAFALATAASLTPGSSVSAQELAREGRAPGWLAPFVQGLAPHGTFTVVDPVGLVWSPDTDVVGTAFIPYVTHGRWEPSPHGWQFVSEFAWGDLVFHYGRWFEDAVAGWVWAPDDAWGASWVDWRADGAVVAWSPRLPDVLAGSGAEGSRRWFTVPGGTLARAPRALPVVLADAVWLQVAAPCGAWPSGRGAVGGDTSAWAHGPDPGGLGIRPGRYRGAPMRGRLPALDSVEVRAPARGSLDGRPSASGSVEVRAPEPVAAPLVLRAGDDRDAFDARHATAPGGAGASAPSIGPLTAGTPPPGTLLVLPAPVRAAGATPVLVTPAAPWLGRPAPDPLAPAPRLAPASPVRAGTPFAPRGAWGAPVPPGPPMAPPPPRAAPASSAPAPDLAPRPALPATRAPDTRPAAAVGLAGPNLRSLGGPR